LSGLLAGRPFESKFDGDESLRMRPMARVLTPLCEMGAKVSYEVVENAEKSNDSSSCAPFSLLGGELTGKSFDLKVASAQVQTALLLAGLQAKGKTSVNSNSTVRDHTERMFRHIGIPVEKNGDGRLEVSALSEPVAPFTISVPGDLSSAAFFIVAAACLPGSDLLIKNVNINQGRRLVIEVLKHMGSEIVLESETEISGEPVADIRVRYNGRLKGATISGDVIASGIDEIPILALAGCTCDGQFVVRGAGELRVKESDRLSAIIENVKAMGVEIEGAEDGFTITGAASIPGNSLWRTYSDHRLAMTGLIASYVCEEPLTVEETNSIKVSYPGFEQQLKLLITT
jgi:3-phosphoshikimate 1-carboxyvinyltransferase